MKLRRGVVFLPLWTQMTISILVVCVASLLIISLVVGIHTWSHGKTLVRQKLELTASMYSARLRDELGSTIDSFSFAMQQPVVTTAIKAQTASNISITETSAVLANLGVFARSVVSQQTTTARGIFISDSSLDQVYSLVLSDETASLSAVLASLQELIPTLQPSFNNYVEFAPYGVILTAPVLTVPSKGTPFYSLSITVPISQTDPYYYGVTGYATLVLDADKLAEKITEGQDSLFKDSDYDLVVITTESNITGFRYAASNSDSFTSLTNTFYPLSQFPAIQNMANLPEPDSYQTTGRSWLSTRTLSTAVASVGCSRVAFYGIEWVFCIETSKSLAVSRVVNLRNKVIGLSIGMLGFVLLMVMPTGRIMTAPLYSIYAQMENPNEVMPPPPKSRLKKFFESAVWLVGIGSPWAGAKESESRSKSAELDDDNAASVASSFNVPHKIKPFGRFYHDELDRLVEEYNGLVSELNNQYYYLEDQVKERTMQAQAARLEAEKANAAKSQFIANITHELRTPLNGIMGMTSVTLSESDIPKVKVALEIILKSGRTLMKLLNELLAFSKSQVEMDPKLSEFTPSEILENLENMFSARSEADKVNIPIEFVRDCSPALLEAQFRGDGHRISQICLHLMSNAIKFSGAGDKVSVHIHYRADQSPRINVAPYASLPIVMSSMGTLEIAVVDSGMGIDEPQLASIFEPFVQGDDTFTKKYDGTGLGMSMCVQLTAVIGASLGVWSAPHRGTVCVLELPVLLVSPLQSSLPAGTTNLNRNGMLYTSSSTQGTVTRCTMDSSSAKRISFMSSESISGSSSSIPQAVPASGDSVLSAPTSSRREWPHHNKKRSVVDSVMGFLRHPHAQGSQPSLAPSKDTKGGKGGHFRTQSAVPALETPPPLVVVPSSAPAMSGSVSASASASNAASNTASNTASTAAEPSVVASPSPRSSLYDPQLINNDIKDRFLQQDHPEYRVLVADDNALNLEIMVKMLKRVGIENVHTATDGAAVVQLVEKSIKLGFHYSVILMDLSMPRLNGFQATDVIRRTLGYPYPVVALTGYSDQRTKRLCDSANIQEILVKPVLRDALISVLVKYDIHDGSQVRLAS